MPTLPRPTIDAIYALYESREASRPPRDYLGGSELGEECARALWLKFRHASREPIGGRMLRLFDTGHREELRIIEDLRAIGVEVLDKDPSTGEQWRHASADGHLSGGLDGVCRGLPEAPKTWHLLEVKSANKKSFAECEAKGVKAWRPKYWAQVQLYMGLAGLERCAFFVWCKDDDSLYMERIEASEKEFKALLLKARYILDAEEAPDHISADPSFYKCKFCPVAGVCRGDAMPLVSCRTCVHAKPGANGSWTCANELPMRPGCGEHVFIPSLLPFAEPVDGAPDWILYRHKTNGREFVNATTKSFPAQTAPHYASRELAAMTPSTIADPTIDAARTILGGEVVQTKLFGKAEPGL
jgi:hypothetical protein